MATKKVIYKEPKSYFTKEMLKAGADYDKQKSSKASAAKTTTKKSK